MQAAGEPASLTTEGLRWLVSPDAPFSRSLQPFAVAGARTRGPIAGTISLEQPEGRAVVVTLERDNCLVRFLGYSAEEIPPPVLLPAGAGTEARFPEWDEVAHERWVQSADDARIVVVGPTASGQAGDRDESG